MGTIESDLTMSRSHKRHHPHEWTKSVECQRLISAISTLRRHNFDFPRLRSSFLPPARPQPATSNIVIKLRGTKYNLTMIEDFFSVVRRVLNSTSAWRRLLTGDVHVVMLNSGFMRKIESKVTKLWLLDSHYSPLSRIVVSEWHRSVCGWLWSVNRRYSSRSGIIENTTSQRA